ncbi:hypothetical protein Ndes2437B_g03383 [Nannochloris sp. 'desiccata']
MVCVLVQNMVVLTPLPTTAPLQARHLCCPSQPRWMKVQHNLQIKTNTHYVLLRNPYPSLAPCRAYVGEQSETAGEYHSQDFHWEICIEEGQAAVERQRQEWRTRAHEQSVGIESKNFKENEKINSDYAKLNTTTKTDKSKGSGWEAFHQQHAAARFFKKKRYIPLAFPALMKSDLHIAEIGCGCGSALLPVLKANPTARATACDVSSTAIELLKLAAEREGIDLNRIHSFPYDASTGATTQTAPGTNSVMTQEQGATASANTLEAEANASGPLAGLHADCVLMIFTLSALWPKDMPCMLRHAYHALRPDGLLLFRDYGLYDMAQLRFPGSQLLDPGESLVYQRSDGTLSSFFSIERMENLAHEAGFQVVECEYVTTFVKNRKKGTEMKRVFVHGVFKKRNNIKVN